LRTWQHLLTPPQVLHLDHNELETLPHCIFHMPQLRVLTLSHNRLPSTCIPEFIDSVANPVNLQASAAAARSALKLTLVRRWCWTTTIWAGSRAASAHSGSCRFAASSLAPEAHWHFFDGRWQVLGCEHNCIPVLPPEFANCRSLTELNMAFNAIEIMPEVLKGITALQVTPFCFFTAQFLIQRPAAAETCAQPHLYSSAVDW
jgi:hypothetical protein